MKLRELYPFIMEDMPVCVITSDGEEKYKTKGRLPVSYMDRDIIKNSIATCEENEALGFDLYDED